MLSSDLISFQSSSAKLFNLINSVFPSSLVFECHLETLEIREGSGSLNCGYGVDFVVEIMLGSSTM